MRFLALVSLYISIFISGCGKSSDSFNDSAGASLNQDRLLYVASGSCYAGGVATSVGAFTVSAFNVETGSLDHVVVDYNSLSPGDAPISIVEYDSDRLLVLVENAAGRRIDLINKDGSQISTYLVNATALSAVVRRMVKMADNSLLVSKSNSIEKFSPARSRVTQGANPYVNAPGAACATATTLISSVSSLGNGKILFTHASPSPNNKITLISANGYASAADCLTSIASPTTTAMPTTSMIHSSGKLLVGFGSLTTASNFIYSYDLDQNTNAINLPIASFNDAAIVNGPTIMTEDPVTAEVFVANGNSAFNTIEKFTFNPISKLLTRNAGQSFIAPQIYTRCVTDMKVLSE